MNLIEITENEILERLLAEPETGMGYQLGNMQRHDQIVEGVFLAGQYFSAFTDAPPSSGGQLDLSRKLLLEPPEAELQSTEYALGALQALRVSATAPQSGGVGVAGPPASPPPFVGHTQPGEKFYRFSAFRLDRRIRANGSLVINSPATSSTDITVVPNGLAAVGRYALPTRISAKYVFEITPRPGTLIQFGTVTPAFGLAGGGVDILFPQGTAPRTVRFWKTIAAM